MVSFAQVKDLPARAATCVLPLIASTPTKPAWRMKADYIEACSCHLFSMTVQHALTVMLSAERRSRQANVIRSRSISTRFL